MALRRNGVAAYDDVKLVIDVNLPQRWFGVLAAEGFEAVHWTDVGDPRARDTEILARARERGRTVFTHDLDFGALLGLTGSSGPSVVQIRTQDVTPEAVAALLIPVLRHHAELLEQGAIVSIDERQARVRILPIRP